MNVQCQMSVNENTELFAKPRYRVWNVITVNKDSDSVYLGFKMT